MGREVKRVPLAFDWPLKTIWPGYTLGVCDIMEQIEERSGQEQCEVCRHWARLAGVALTNCGCPKVEIDPPTGDGWQLWETVSEGSPVSPVFLTPEELADWLVSPGNDESITKGTTREQWLRMICGPGYAVSMVHDEKGLRPGVQAV